MAILGKNIEHDLRMARPKLSHASPLIWWISVGFVGFNIWIGAAIAATPPLRPLTIETPPLTPHFWGGIFVLLGLWILFGLIRNSWRVIRWAMIAGTTVKLIWTYAIIQLLSVYGFSKIGGTLGIWLFITWVQAGVVIHFLPPLQLGKSDGAE